MRSHLSFLGANHVEFTNNTIIFTDVQPRTILRLHLPYSGSRVEQIMVANFLYDGRLPC